MTAVLVDLGAGAAASSTTLAQQQPPPPEGEEFGKASPIALVVILLLALGTIVLIRSMSKRIKRLPESFDPPPAERAPDDAQDRQGG